MTELKICGLRDVERAITAAEAGADFLGFVFVPRVRRQISAEQAKDIIGEYRKRRGVDGPKLVGLFADQPVEEVNETVAYAGLDLAQLCGDETPEYWRKVSVPFIKQIKVREQGAREQAVAETLRQVEEVSAHDHMVMLDRYETGAKGGSGRSFDWRIAREVAKRHDFLLAGGLTSENVAHAVALVAPWGVDVSSGVETDGVKDAKKIVAFAREVARADRRTG